MSSLLLGPPEIQESNSLLQKPTTVSDPSVYSSPPMGRTENGAATYLSAGNPCLDFFFHVVPSTSTKNLIKLFLDNDGEINPMAIMEAAISGLEYSKLVVVVDSGDKMAKVWKPEVKTGVVKKHLPATLCSACKNRACKNRVKKKSGPALHGSSQSIALRNSFHMLESDEE